MKWKRMKRTEDREQLENVVVWKKEGMAKGFQFKKP